jgi:membrane protein implicated in regulation of membrane protease activity
MDWPNDGVAAFFLVCFFVGLLFTVGSFFLNMGHGAFHAHDGHFDHDLHTHFGGGQAGHDDAPGATAGGPASGGHDGTVKSQLQQSGPSFFNLSSAMAFLTWFGGAGYILRIYYGAWLPVAVGIAFLAGVIGAALVFFFLSRVLFASQRVLDPRDYYLPGTLARVTSPIRAGGTGEVVYTKGDTRQVSGARSLDGREIERGAEVVIMRYERGLAYVQRWDDLMREEEEERPSEPSTPAER